MEETKSERKNINWKFFFVFSGILAIAILISMDFYFYKEHHKSLFFSILMKESDEKKVNRIMENVVKSFPSKNVKININKEFKTWRFLTPSLSEARAQTAFIFKELQNKGIRSKIEWDKQKPETVRMEIYSKDRNIGAVIFQSMEVYEERKEDIEKYEGEFAIIIDDIGYSVNSVEELVKIKEPLTLSILPFLPDSQVCADIAKKNGKEIMIHMPMESNNGNDPEKDIIKETMTEEEIRFMIGRAISSLPDAKGMNNHKGSKITQREYIMEIILSELKKNNLFFIDSKTSDHSIALKTARRLGVLSSERSIFLDSINSKPEIKKNILKLFKIAKTKKRAIGIAHPYPDTIEVLKEMLPKVKYHSVKPVFVSEIIKNK